MTIPSRHIVAQGEHLSKIAKRHGFSDYRTIWNHPQNADVREKRQNPNVLFPGDVLFIPDKELRIEARATDERHRFVVKRTALKLRLVVEDLYETPVRNAPCELVIEGEVTRHITDGTGLVEQEILPDAHDGWLVLRGEETPFRDTLIPMKIGDLDPEDTTSGQLARLNNLGYLPGDGTDPDAFRSAVEEFQCDHPPLKVDGTCGKKTQEQLKKVHGC